MNNDSLEKAINVIVSNIDSLDLNIIDKTELLINLRYFLDSDMYDENIKLLRKNAKK